MGLAFGFFLKRSRLCLSASLRDIYVEKKIRWFMVVPFYYFNHQCYLFFTDCATCNS